LTISYSTASHFSTLDCTSRKYAASAMWTAPTRRTFWPAALAKVTSEVSSEPPFVPSPTKRRKRVWSAACVVAGCVAAVDGVVSA
jgi:hypothetical protein